MKNTNPDYTAREQIQLKLANAAEAVNGPDDKVLLTDAANWIGKFGLSHGALQEVMSEARKRCDPDTVQALEAAMQRGTGIVSY